MSVSDSPTSKTSSIPNHLSDFLQIEDVSQTLIVRMGRRKELSDVTIARCREEIAKWIERGEVGTIVFDLEGLLVLPSSALGLIAAVSQTEAKVRVTNACDCAQEDFELTGLCQLIELEPALPPRK